jgi:branched-chain amino acid transport system permease protein
MLDFLGGIDPHSFMPLAVDWNALTSSLFWLNVGVTAGIYALLALGLQLNVGFTGITNFGQAGFMAIGAYTMAILTVDTGISFWLTLPISMLTAMAFGVLVGLPSLRLRADYFAIATIASAELVRIVAQNAQSLTGGNQGFFCNDDQTKCFDDTWALHTSKTIEGWLQDLGWDNPSSLAPLLIVTIIAVLLVTVALRYTQGSPWGRVLRAIREDEDAARALGKNAFAYKLQSLAISAGIAAIGGWLLALDLATIHPTDFEPLVTFFAYSVLILGGLANYWGVIAGSVVLWTLLEGTRFVEIFQDDNKTASLRFAIVGLVMILLMAFRPQGMFGKKEEMVLGE